MRVVALYISPGHSFFGQHGQDAAEYPMLEVPTVTCVAGKGLEGDRFFDYRSDYKGQVTFFSGEVYDALCQALQIFDRPHSAFRRNAITRGVDLNELVGREFDVQGIRFKGTEECRPCAWMDVAFGGGAEDFLRGRGGLRAKILHDGVLRQEA